MVDSLSDAGRLVDDWERNATEKAARFQAMAGRVEQVSITESVADGAIRVTVGHNGLPTDLAMTEQVLRMKPDEIAANVMAGIRKAQSRYPERLAEILAETVGTEDPAARHILATAEQNFPPVADEEEDQAQVEPPRIGHVEDDDETPKPPARPAPRPDGTGGGDDDGNFDDESQIFDR
jgi:YbaB/EbfC DNA-binding family protein